MGNSERFDLMRAGSVYTRCSCPDQSTIRKQRRGTSVADFVRILRGLLLVQMWMTLNTSLACYGTFPRKATFLGQSWSLLPELLCSRCKGFGDQNCESERDALAGMIIRASHAED